MNLKKIIVYLVVASVIFLTIFFYRTPISLTSIEDINEASQKAGKGNTKALKFLIRNLENTNPDIQKEAYNSITKIGKPAIPLLIKLLENKDPSLQEYGAGLLGSIKDNDSLPVLIQHLSSPNFKHKYVLCWALGEIGDANAIEPLIDIYPNSKEDTQKYILRALVKIGKPALPYLLKNLESNDLSLQKLSILSLGQIRGEDLVPLLLKIVNEKNIEFITLALGDLADPEGIDFLIKSLKHPAWQVRQKSAQSLTRFTDMKILPPLRAALNDEVAAVREWAAKAIECISEEKCEYKNGQGELVYPDSLYR